MHVMKLFFCVHLVLLFQFFAYGAEYLLLDLQSTNENRIGKWIVSENMLPHWSEEYKTRYLVLRKIEIPEVSDETPIILKDIIPQNPYYIGVFEITQRQWELIMGDRPSYFRNDKYYQTRPVERVDYLMVRGKNEVYPDCFLERLRKVSGLMNLDLPTEKQWEYACRASTVTPFHNGRILPIGWEEAPGDWCNDVARTYDNTPNAYLWKPGSGQNKVFWAFGYYERKFLRASPSYTGTQVVGYYQPNAFGLFDMHGNVSELCLDYFDGDPSCVLLKGGCWIYNPEACTSGYRSKNQIDVVSLLAKYGSIPNGTHETNNHVGFRIVLNISL